MADSCVDGPMASASVSDWEARRNAKDVPRGALKKNYVPKGLAKPPIKDDCTVELRPKEIIVPSWKQTSAWVKE